MQRQQTLKPVMATYYPSEIRQQSVGKENRSRHITSCSQIKYINQTLNIGPSIRTIDAYDTQKNNSQLECQIDRLKVQIIEMQQEQNILNEQFQIQIKSMHQRMENNESSVQQLFDSGIMSMGNDQKYVETINQIECKLGDFQLLLANVEIRASNQLTQQLEQVRKFIVDQIQQQESSFQDNIRQLYKDISQINEKWNDKIHIQQQQNDVIRFQQFNEDVTNYLNQRQLNPQSPQKKNQSQENKLNCISDKQLDRSQLSAISEQTMEESRVFEQKGVEKLLLDQKFDLDPQLQYELDENGYLLIKGECIYDQSGDKYQLSKEQIKYLQLINVLEEIR